MANRNFNRYQALVKEAKSLFATVAIGSTGAPTLDAASSPGIASVARTSTGRYTITLQDKYVQLLQVIESRQLASGAPSAVGGMVIRANSTDLDAKTLVIEFVDGSGAPVELVSGSILRLEIVLKNSTAK